jgi:hypothetical protein
MSENTYMATAVTISSEVATRFSMWWFQSMVHDGEWRRLWFSISRSGVGSKSVNGGFFMRVKGNEYGIMGNVRVWVAVDEFMG